MAPGQGSKKRPRGEKRGTRTGSEALSADSEETWSMADGVKSRARAHSEYLMDTDTFLFLSNWRGSFYNFILFRVIYLI